MSSSFQPLRPVSHGAVQTVASIIWPQTKNVGGIVERCNVSIADDGFLSVIENRPPTWTQGGRVVFLVHGLTGSEDSTHLVRLASAFVRRGILTVRMNMRGCGPGLGLASGIYHSGRSGDAKAVLEWIAHRHPNSPITQIGISLGGNATLKMVGEYGSDCPAFLDSVVAVSPPIDLALCSERLSHWKNFLFDRYFTGRLVQHIRSLNAQFPEKVTALPESWNKGPISLARLDDMYVAPVSGFLNGQDYYRRCSAAPLIGDIKCRTLLLTAEDDPIIDPLPFVKLPRNSQCQTMITRKGGHAAWISNKKCHDFGRFWMDQFVVNWVMEGHN
jgi:predicted alpha/beta-fold hydrolase